jgi:hypothetical protein
MHNGSGGHRATLALVLSLAAAAAGAQGGIAAAPDKAKGATKQPDTGEVHSVTGPSTTSLSPKRTHKAKAKAKTASAAASQ